LGEGGRCYPAPDGKFREIVRIERERGWIWVLVRRKQQK